MKFEKDDGLYECGFARNRIFKRENRRGRFRIIAGGFKSERGCVLKTEGGYRFW